MTTDTSNKFAEQVQQARDLRTQIADLERDSEQEILFQEWSPGRKMVKLWSTTDGMEITIPKYMVAGALTKRNRRTGKWAFTADQSEAPLFRNGIVRCFLAEDSPERDSGLLAEAGLDHLEPCPAVELRSTYSKRIHAINRHPQSWATLQDHLSTQRDDEMRDEQRKQTAAMMSLAGSRAPEPVRTARVVTMPAKVVAGEVLSCDCGYQTQAASKNPKASLGMHQRMHCPLRGSSTEGE